MADNTKEIYEAPSLTDFGTIENVTKGEVKVNTTDFPVGSPVVSGSL